MASNDLIRVLLEAELNSTTSIKNIEKQLNEISGKIKPIEIRFDLDDKKFKDLKSISEQLQKQMANTTKVDTSQMEAGLQRITNHFKDGEEKASRMTKTTVAGFEKTVELIDKINNKSIKKDVTYDFEKERKSVEKEYQLIADLANKELKKKQETKDLARKLTYEEEQTRLKVTTEIQSKIEKWVLNSNETISQQQSRLNRTNANDYEKMWQQAFKSSAQEQEKIIQKAADFQKRMLTSGDLKGEMDIFASKYKGKYNTTEFDRISKEISSLQNLPLEQQQQRIKGLSIEWNQLKQTAMQSGSVITRTIENMTKFMRYYIAGGFLVGIVREIKSGVESIKELDSSLTELSKVSDLTGNQLKVFTDRAYEAGNQIARTGKEVIDATAEFKRAGYELEDAFELSQQALLLTNIGDGITDVKEASSSLIAILKGFKMEASETAHIVDALNEVSNNYAIDTINLTEIMKRVSGTIAQTGTSYEELLGLSVGGFESLRNAEMVASGINMISQRLKGMAEDGSKVEGLIPKIQEAFDKYTKGAVSIIDKQNGGLHSTYEILSQLQKVYPQLSGEAKAYLNEAVAGNRQNKVLVAIMENWENVEKATMSATNSLGSANEENLKYLDSIEGRTKKLTSTTQLFWNNLINSDVIKNGISLLTGLVSILDILVNNSFAHIIITTGLLTTTFVLLNKGLGLLKNSYIENALGLVALDVAEKGLLATTKALTATMWASPLFKVALVVTAITAIIKITDKYADTLKNLNKRIDETTSALTELQSEYDSLKSKENLTEEQKLYLKLLEKEIERKKESLAIDTEMALKREFLNKETLKGGGYTVTTSSGAEKIHQSIVNLQKYKSELRDIDVEQEKGKKQWDDISSKIRDAEDDLNEQLKTIVTGIEKIKEYNPEFIVPQELEEAKTAMEDVLGITDDLSGGIDDADKSFKNLDATIKMFKDNISELGNKLQDLEGIQDKVNDGYTFSYTEISELRKTYPELEKAIYRTADGWKVEKGALDKVREAMIEHTRNQIESEKENTQNTINEIKNRITARITEAKSLSLLAGTNASDVDEVSIMTAEQPKKPMDGRMSTILENMVIEKKNDIAKAKRELLPLETSMTELENLLAKLDEIGTGRVTGELKSKKPKEKDDRQFLESIDAEIRAIKLKNDNLLKTEKLLQEQLKLAKDIEGIDGLNEQYRITGEIIEHNKVMLESFKKEQDLVHARANAIRESNKKYDTTNWFDSMGEQTVEYINLYNKATKSQQEEMSTLFNKIQALKKAWMESGNEINKIVDLNKELVIQQDKLLDQQYELARTNWIKEQNEALKDRRDRLQSLQTIEEAIVAIIRKRGEEEKKALDEAHKMDMDSLEERHKERKKKYAEEFDLFKKMIQDKIDALDEQYEEEDYLEQLNKEREEANRLQKEIDVLSLDDSLTARNKTIELRKQLADQNDKIAKMQQKKERDLLKKSLQDQLKNREQDAKDKEAIADKTYENDKKRLEEDYRINKEFLDKKYSDEQVYAEARESIMRGTVEVAEGMFVDIYDAYKDFENKFGRGMGILGDIIKKDFLDQLEKAQQAVRDLEYLSRARDDYDSDYRPHDDEWDYRDPRDSGGSSGGNNSRGGNLSDMSKSDYYKYVQMKQLWEMAKASGDTKSADYANQVNKELRNKYGITNDSYSWSQLKDIKWEDLKKLGFDNGGKIIGTGSTLVDFHGTKNKPEWIFNDSQLKDIVRDVTLSTMKIATPRIPSVIPQQGITLQIDNFIKADNITKESIPELKKIQSNAMEDLKNLLNKNGVRPSLL